MTTDPNRPAEVEPAAPAETDPEPLAPDAWADAATAADCDGAY